MTATDWKILSVAINQTSLPVEQVNAEKPCLASWMRRIQVALVQSTNGQHLVGALRWITRDNDHARWNSSG